jgi:hypothetical protein
MASRTTVRLTLNCCTSTASVGSLSPVAMRPERISASSAWATWSDSLAPGLMATKETDMQRALGVEDGPAEEAGLSAGL